MNLGINWALHGASTIVERYQHVLLTLLELGWNGNLDVELELPRKYMPPQYHRRHEQGAPAK
jgi:hypothetical protein